MLCTLCLMAYMNIVAPQQLHFPPFIFICASISFKVSTEEQKVRSTLTLQNVMQKINVVLHEER